MTVPPDPGAEVHSGPEATAKISPKETVIQPTVVELPLPTRWNPHDRTTPGRAPISKKSGDPGHGGGRGDNDNPGSVASGPGVPGKSQE